MILITKEKLAPAPTESNQTELKPKFTNMQYLYTSQTEHLLDPEVNWFIYLFF